MWSLSCWHRVRPRIVGVLILLAWLCVVHGGDVQAAASLKPLPIGASRPVAQLQTERLRFVPLLITPLEATSVQLQMHTAAFQFDDSTGSLTLAVVIEFASAVPYSEFQPSVNQ